MSNVIDKIRVNGTDYDVGGSGGVTSWNDLQDRPFYEEENTIEIEWDGSTEGRETVDVSDFFDEGAYYVKVSEETPIMESISKADLINNADSVYSFDNSKMIAQTGCYAVGWELVVVVTDYANSNLMGIISFPSNGVWMSVADNEYIKKVVLSSNVIHPIDEKYLPDWVLALKPTE
jgi:hypothetical protein